MFPIGIVPIPHPPPRAKKASSDQPNQRSATSEPRVTTKESRPGLESAVSDGYADDKLNAKPDALTTSHVEKKGPLFDPVGEPSCNKALPHVLLNTSEYCNVDTPHNLDPAIRAGYVEVENSASHVCSKCQSCTNVDLERSHLEIADGTDGEKEDDKATDDAKILRKSVAPSILSTVASVNEPETPLNKRAWLGAETLRRGLRKSKSSYIPRRRVTTTTDQSSRSRFTKTTRFGDPTVSQSSRSLGRTLKERLSKRSLTNFTRFRPHRATRSDSELCRANEGGSKPSLVRTSHESQNIFSAAFSRRKNKEHMPDDLSLEPPVYRYKRLCPYKEVAGCGARLKILKGASLLLTGIPSKDSLIPDDEDLAGPSQPSLEDDSPTSITDHEDTDISENSQADLGFNGDRSDTYTRPEIGKACADACVKDRSGECDSEHCEVPTVSFNSDELGHGQVEFESRLNLAPPREFALAGGESSDRESVLYDPEAIIDSYTHSDRGSDVDASFLQSAMSNLKLDNDHAGLSASKGSTLDQTSLAPIGQDSTNVVYVGPSSASFSPSEPNRGGATIGNCDETGVHTPSATINSSIERAFTSTYIESPATRLPPTLNHPAPSAIIAHGDSHTGTSVPEAPNYLHLRPMVNPAGHQRAHSETAAVGSGWSPSHPPGSTDFTFAPADLESLECGLRNSAHIAARLLGASNLATYGARRSELFAELSSLIVDAEIAAEWSHQKAVNAAHEAESARIAHEHISAVAVQINELRNQLLRYDEIFLAFQTRLRSSSW